LQVGNHGLETKFPISLPSGMQPLLNHQCQTTEEKVKEQSTKITLSLTEK